MPRVKTVAVQQPTPEDAVIQFQSFTIGEQVWLLQQLQSIMEEIKNQKSKELELLKSIHTTNGTKS